MLRALQRGVPSLLREPRAMSLQLAAISYVYIFYGKKKERKERTVVAKTTVHKHGSVQRFKFAGRRECSAGQWVI